MRVVDAKDAGDIDYAVFRVSPVPPVHVEVDLSARPPVGRSLTIFSHPRRRPLEWSGVCALEPRGSNGANQFGHQCDTESGSSGAAFIDDTTLRVIGVHDGYRGAGNYGSYRFNTPLGGLLGAPSSDLGGGRVDRGRAGAARRHPRAKAAAARPRAVLGDRRGCRR